MVLVYAVLTTSWQATSRITGYVQEPSLAPITFSGSLQSLLNTFFFSLFLFKNII